MSMRLQGMTPEAFKVAVSQAQLGKQIGNAMSCNVLERLFVRLLPAAGLAPAGSLVDRWGCAGPLASSPLEAAVRRGDCGREPASGPRAASPLDAPRDGGADAPCAPVDAAAPSDHAPHVAAGAAVDHCHDLASGDGGEGPHHGH